MTKINKIREAFLDRLRKLRDNPSHVRVAAMTSSKTRASEEGATASYKHREWKDEKLKFSASHATKNILMQNFHKK